MRNKIVFLITKLFVRISELIYVRRNTFRKLFVLLVGCVLSTSIHKQSICFYFQVWTSNYTRGCSTSPSGGNQVDGSPPALSNTGVYAFWAHMPSSKSVTWQSNGSDFSKSDHYYCLTWILLKVSQKLEASLLILRLWEAVVSDFDRRVVLKKWKIEFWDIF